MNAARPTPECAAAVGGGGGAAGRLPNNLGPSRHVMQILTMGVMSRTQQFD